MTTIFKLHKPYPALIALTLTSVSLSAQIAPAGVGTSASASTMAAPNAGLVNDWLREQTPFFEPFDLGGQFRARYVYQTYFAVPGAGPTAADFRANTPNSENDFLLLRTRVHFGYSPTE